MTNFHALVLPNIVLDKLFCNMND